MTIKHKSIFKVVLDSVSKIGWLKGIRQPVHKHMKPGKDFNQPVLNLHSDYLKELSHDEFKILITMLFKQRGYTIPLNKEYDDIDLILQMNNEITFVKFNHWQDELLDETEVAQLYVAMKEENAAHGIIITSGIFTPEALDLSLGKAMLLINGVDLSQLIETLKSATNLEAEEKEVIEEPAQDEMPEIEPLCPICSSEMIKRTAKKGKNAGNTFWGCSKFPGCRGVISN